MARLLLNKKSSQSSGENDVQLVNFDDFLRLLEVGQEDSVETQIKLLFELYSTDGRCVTAEDIYVVLKNIVGSQLPEVKLKAVIHKTVQELGLKRQTDQQSVLYLNQFSKIF